MPYGIPNEKPNQTKWMESCVESVMGQNKDYDKSRAIAICKAQLKNNNWKVKKGEAELSMREELWELEKKIREAITGPMTDQPSSGPWVADVFDDYVIVEKGSSLYKVNWSLSGDSISVDWDTAVEVERKTVYDPVSESTIKVPNVKGAHRVITWGNRTI